MQSAVGVVREEIVLGAGEASALSARSVATTASVRASAGETLFQAVKGEARVGLADSLQGLRSSPVANISTQMEEIALNKDLASNAFSTGLEGVLQEIDPTQSSSVTVEARKLLNGLHAA